MIDLNTTATTSDINKITNSLNDNSFNAVSLDNNTLKSTITDLSQCPDLLNFSSTDSLFNINMYPLSHFGIMSNPSNSTSTTVSTTTTNVSINAFNTNTIDLKNIPNELFLENTTSNNLYMNSIQSFQTIPIDYQNISNPPDITSLINNYNGNTNSFHTNINMSATTNTNNQDSINLNATITTSPSLIPNHIKYEKVNKNKRNITNLKK